MNTTAIKKLVWDAYAVTDNDVVLPRFSTQFTVSDKQLLIRIPIYECQPPPKPLTALISRVIGMALPNFKKKPADLEQDLLAAAEGKQMPGAELDIRGVVVSTSVLGGSRAHAVTECRVLIRESASTPQS